MAPVTLFVTATKLAGVLATITVAANAFSFSRYRKRNLAPFDCPIDETSDTLATFNINSSDSDDEEEEHFFFGLATAPAHVEDGLNDAWLQEERLRFWSDPDTELKLAKDTGVKVFRMGIDWTRIMPIEPLNGLKESHWRDIDGSSIEFNLMLVDYWVTFNEPHVFCMLTYCAGTWPGGHPDMLEAATSALPTGVFHQAMHWIAVAHSQAYDYIHEQSVLLKPIVGVAHHVSFMRPYGLFDVAAVSIANSLSLFPFLDDISDKMDYIGINYYGQEVIGGAALKLVDTDEYSESGRGVYPDGLFRVLLHYHERYKDLKIPFIIAENGISDETDLIRRPYILEHLLAVYGAMMMGVRVLGYLFWTTSDNWEWADGYGPKFGLVAVDRFNDLARVPRPSYHLYSKVVTTGKITREDRDKAWYELRKAAREKKTRPFYRGLDEPIMRPFIERDWRFGHYEMEGLQDPFSRFSRSILRLLPLRRKKAEDQVEYDEVAVQAV
ncbi:Glycoside hydrolase, catalytic domain-containing protein [Cynara cardunculus var. scolymus]|uniref:Glycoside hydrolase, catalytic domain-containing protein n=1 Tax=Cynara cardunculus var. scolymus TaxID=59895 RepID=A0A118JS35_CYNCS|nr:Glycoside hydrolase, catalytic domain-containing protein [Cynara cardunculus var. scolymus]